MSVLARAVTLLVAFLAVVGGIFFVVVHILLAEPPTVDFTTGHVAGQPVDMTIMADPVNDVSNHPDWVSYFVRSPRTGKWVHTTIWQLPAHTRINVTAYQFDTCDPLRNQFNGRVSGTVGNVMSVSGEADGVNGKGISVVNSDTTCGVAHTFSVPELGINVPLGGETYTGKNECTQGPCAISTAHTTTTFSFITPAPGDYRWQCFIPCGLASVDGNGHAMSTIGFMTGYRNRFGALLSWWFAFTRDLRRERTFTTEYIDTTRDIYTSTPPLLEDTPTAPPDANPSGNG